MKYPMLETINEDTPSVKDKIPNRKCTGKASDKGKIAPSPKIRKLVALVKSNSATYVSGIKRENG